MDSEPLTVPESVPAGEESCLDWLAEHSVDRAHLRPVVPLGRWRTGTNTIPARARIGSDDRALPGLQAEIPARSQRQTSVSRTPEGYGPTTDLGRAAISLSECVTLQLAALNPHPWCTAILQRR
jgi:hypothetical protein